MISTPLKLLAAATLLASAGLAQAMPTKHIYSLDDVATGPLAGQKPRAGLITAIETTYVPNEQRFTWSHTMTANSHGTTSDGFWLVVSDGDNPKGDTDEYAILFGDLQNERLTAYLYNGRNSSSSWRDPAIYLQSFDDDLVVERDGNGTTRVSFELDVAGINGLDVNAIPGHPDYVPQPNIDWDGIAFGRRVGIWFHPTANSTFAYDDTTGHIERFRPGTTGWLDGKNYTTNRVPEPGILYLVGLGALAFVLSRTLLGGRRRTARAATGAPAGPALAI